MFFEQFDFRYERNDLQRLEIRAFQKIGYYLFENQLRRKRNEKKYQKMLAGIGKIPTFAPQFNAEERWVSG